MDQQASLALGRRCAMVSSKGEDGEPPAYSSLASSSASVIPDDLSHPPSWRVVVHESNRCAASHCSLSESRCAIKGNYALDAGRGPDATGSHATASLTTSNGTIDVSISVLGDHKADAEIVATTSNAPINVSVVCQRRRVSADSDSPFANLRSPSRSPCARAMVRAAELFGSSSSSHAPYATADSLQRRSSSRLRPTSAAS